jgi:predicted O-linked N-acetylglucosamine transferase (SPINDLY family)
MFDERKKIEILNSKVVFFCLLQIAKSNSKEVFTQLVKILTKLLAGGR